MFLLNSCLSLFSAALPKRAPFLPKLQGHFAEFLDNASSVGLRILSSSTCVGLRYGYSINYSGFSRHMAHMLPYSFFGPRRVFPLPYGFSYRTGTSLVRGFPLPAHALHMRPCSSVITQYRNLNLLSIGYVSRPRLRSRLTRGRQALPRKPQIFGRKDSHLSLATHSGILSSMHSTAPYRYRFVAHPMLLYQCINTFLSFGVVFQPRTFSARDLSTSELLRTLSMNGCF